MIDSRYAQIVREMKLCGLCSSFKDKSVCAKCQKRGKVSDSELNEFWVQTQEFKTKLESYEREHSEGRLLSLPCKIGSIVYYLEGYRSPQIRLFEVREMVITKSELILCDSHGSEWSADVCYSTREEAVRASEALKEVNEFLIKHSMVSDGKQDS